MVGKEESLDRVVQCVLQGRRVPPDTAVSSASDLPLLNTTEVMWSLGTAQVARGIAQFTMQAQGMLERMRKLLDEGETGKIPGALHTLCGTISPTVAKRLYRAVHTCKTSLDHAKLESLKELLAATIEAMEAELRRRR
jgi:hypothetical protein